MKTTGQKWNGFILALIALVLGEGCVIGLSVLAQNYDFIGMVTTGYFIAIAGVFGTLVTGRVLTDKDIAINYKPELDTRLSNEYFSPSYTEKKSTPS